ncbi:MAG TPA: serine hydrolase [Terriglobales bacterium]|nr:serine hydrolase [Terriglobales bacterium]
MQVPVPRFLIPSILLSTSLLWAQQSSSTAATELVGLWGAEQMFGPMVRGELILDGRGGGMRARIAGFEVAVERQKGRVRFVLPGDKGEFRGRVETDGKVIRGLWIQPPGFALNQRYASPVELSLLAPQVWRGQVVPLDHRTSFYLTIERGADGSLPAYLRNPEANWFGQNHYDFSRDGDKIALRCRQQPLRCYDEEGTYDAENNRILLSLVTGAPPLQLTRRAPALTLGFAPRAPLKAPYVYQKPITEDDGWPTATLTEVGIDPKPIAALIEKILNADPAENAFNIQGLLIARHGKLVLEEYFYGFSKERPHDMRSASKTFGPLLVGVARDRGYPIGPETLLYPLFPEYKSFANPDPRKQEIKLGDLMNMTSGLGCEDHNPNSKGSENYMQEQTEQPDWYKFALDLPMVKDPGGEDAVYCSSDINLLAGAVRNVTKTFLPEFFEEHIARPMQFRTFHMNLMPTGEGYAGGGLHLRPRDQIKLGELYLRGGVWNGKQVISRAWVMDSLKVRANFPPRPGVDFDQDHGYGYAWHSHPLKVGDRVFRDYYAGGNGGQMVIILPELDMVVLFTGGNYNEYPKIFAWELDLLPRYVIPAVRDAAKPAGR